MAVPDLLRGFGVDPQPLLAEFDLDLADFEDADRWIRFTTQGRVLDRCAQATGCPHFGLLTGQRTSLSSFGAIGFLMQSAPSVRSALRAAAAGYRTQNGGVAIEVVEDGAFVSFGYRILEKNSPGREQLMDGAMAAAFKALRGLCGRDWLPAQVDFAHRTPTDTAPFRQFFRTSLRFGQSETALIFGRHWMDSVPPGADPLLNRMMAQRVSALDRSFGNDLADLLRRMLPGLVTARNDSLAAAAAQAGLGPRTLIRRLAAEGTSFAQLRDEARLHIASQLLETTSMPASEIAERIGYANPSSFTRAFLRWTGLGPADWRKSRRVSGKPKPRAA